MKRDTRPTKSVSSLGALLLLQGISWICNNSISLSLSIDQPNENVHLLNYYMALIPFDPSNKIKSDLPNGPLLPYSTYIRERSSSHFDK